MTSGQVILLIASVTITAVTFLFDPLLPPDKKIEGHSVAATAASDFDFETYAAGELKKLPAGELEKYEKMLQDLSESSDKAGMLGEIALLLEKNELNILAALRLKESAALVNADSVWNAAGANLYENAFTTDNQPLSRYVISQAIDCYQKALELNPEYDDAKIRMAVAYLEGQTEPMKGVTLLREIIDKDPDNITANLILGKYGIVSGQFDKAAQRLEKVLSIDSLNVDAYLYLAEAYEGMGNKAKAIEALEKCRDIVQHSGFSKEISKYIEKLRNS